MLWKLAKYILDAVDDLYLEEIYLDTDFKDRTLMKIISENEYSEMFESERIDLLLHEIWQGEGVR